MSAFDGPTLYEIRVRDRLDGRWSAWFEGMTVESEGDQTTISGSLPDESALYGVLSKVRDLGLTLIGVRRLDLGGRGGGEDDPPEP